MFFSHASLHVGPHTLQVTSDSSKSRTSNPLHSYFTPLLVRVNVHSFFCSVGRSTGKGVSLPHDPIRYLIGSEKITRIDLSVPSVFRKNIVTLFLLPGSAVVWICSGVASKSKLIRDCLLTGIQSEGRCHGNLVTQLSTVGARLGHSRGTKLKTLGHSQGIKKLGDVSNSLEYQCFLCWLRSMCFKPFFSLSIRLQFY